MLLIFKLNLRICEKLVRDAVELRLMSHKIGVMIICLRLIGAPITQVRFPIWYFLILVLISIILYQICKSFFISQLKHIILTC